MLSYQFNPTSSNWKLAAFLVGSLLAPKYAEAYGARGWRVEKAEELAPTLEAAFKAGGVHLVTAPIDYSESIRVLIDELRQAVPADPQFKTD